MKRFKIAPEIYYEKNAINHLENIIQGGKAFIITDQLMIKLGLVEQITAILDRKSVQYEIFPEISGEPSLGIVTLGLKKFLDFNGDLLIALGGGSVMDASKAIMYFIRQMGIDQLGHKKSDLPFFIVIPTTSGTGSEVTSYTVITDESQNIKIALQNDEKFADVALLDCNLIKTVPPHITAETGMDILTHAIEAFVSNQASDFTDAFAQMAIEMVFFHLVTCYQNGSDDLGREKIHNASCMAGMAFENSSVGLNHSMAHALGAKFKIAHGRANAVLLPYVIKYNSGLFEDSSHIEFATANKYCKITRLLHLPTLDLKEGVTMLSKAIMTLNSQMDIAVCIRDLGIEHHEFEQALPEMCSAAMADICTPGNPRVPCEKDINTIFRTAYNGQG